MSQLNIVSDEKETRTELVLAIIFEMLERGVLCLVLILAGAYLRVHPAGFGESELSGVFHVSGIVLFALSIVTATLRARRITKSKFVHFGIAMFGLLLVAGIVAAGVRQNPAYMEVVRSMKTPTPPQGRIDSLIKDSSVVSGSDSNHVEGDTLQ